MHMEERKKKYIYIYNLLCRTAEGTNHEVMEEVGRPLFKAFVAYQDGDFAAAVDLLNPVRYRVITIGGSHAQVGSSQFALLPTLRSLAWEFDTVWRKCTDSLTPAV